MTDAIKTPNEPNTEEKKPTTCMQSVLPARFSGRRIIHLIDNIIWQRTYVN